MGNRILILSVCIMMFLLTSNYVMTSNAYTSGDLPNYLEEMNVNIPIKIYLWSENTIDIEQFVSSLPENIIQESLYPRSNETDIWQVNLEGTFFGLKNTLDIEVIIADPTDYDIVMSDIVNRSVQTNVDLGSIGIFSGYSVDKEILNDNFGSYSSSNSYNIHVLDFGELYNGSDHWFTVEETLEISSKSEDMRNMYNLGNRQLVYDPTGIAPYFDILPQDISTITAKLEEHLVETIPVIIEEVILGSPQAFNLLALEEEIHVARIIIGTQSNDIEYNQARNSQAYQAFDRQVGKIFSGFNLKQSSISINISEIPPLDQFLQDKTRIIDGQETVIVDFEFAETFKQYIREYEYTDFPVRYYYGLFAFVDADRRYMMNVTENGETTDRLVEYNVGEIGFTMASFRDFYQISTFELSTRYIASRYLNLLGQNFGLGMLAGNLSNQIDSPMNSYGVSEAWQLSFNQIELDQIQRRLSLIYLNYMLHHIEVIREQLSSPLYFWVDESDLNAIEIELQGIIPLLEALRYGEAITELLDIKIRFDSESEIVQRSYRTINYGFPLIVLVILLAFYSKILIEDSVSKDEFKERVENHRSYNLNRNKNARDN